jgi:hypothetical protein
LPCPFPLCASFNAAFSCSFAGSLLILFPLLSFSSLLSGFCGFGGVAEFDPEKKLLIDSTLANYARMDKNPVIAIE